MRILAAGIAGLAIAALSAVVLGDYPLSGSVPWLAAVLVPFLIGAAMVLIAGGFETTLWVITGPVSAVAMLWGIRISTGWGLDPVPPAAWISVVLALSWPPGWAALVSWRSGQAKPPTHPREGTGDPG